MQVGSLNSSSSSLAPAAGNSERAVTLRRALAAEGADRNAVMQSSLNGAIIEATYGAQGRMQGSAPRGTSLGVA